MSSDSYDSGLVGEVGERLEESFWARSRNDLILWLIRSYFPGARSVLEVGCGTGIVLRAVHTAMPQLELVGVDLDPSALEHARSLAPSVEWTRIDGRDLPYASKFDVVMALDVVEHVEDDEKVIEQLYRASKPGGGVIVAVPQHAWLWSPADDDALHFRRYSRRELVTKLQRAGFEISRVTSFVALLLPVMLLQRLRTRMTDEYDPLQEYALPRAADAAFFGVMKVESALIRAGVPLPVGGSLLVVGRKSTLT